MFALLANIAWGYAQTYAPCSSVEATYLTAPSASTLPAAKPKLSLVALKNVLVIQERVSDNQVKSHRVTFQTPSALSELSEVCEITPIALIQGGDWGWHVLWQTAKGIFYARVDGEAWVSSVPKRLAEHGFDVRMQVIGEKLHVEWNTSVEQTQPYRVVSVDEGRNWE